ncbi:MAG: site-specific DNA-methyltransferase [Phycisphaerae bacterium]
MATRNYGDLSKDELVRLLEARDRREATRFGLVWEANEIERDKALNKDFVALELDRPLCCGAGPWRNLIIEGDNFDALRYLRMTFAGRVKCIYIDPPYNTGNRDFIYNDRFVDKEDLWRHSKWCEFMYQRLTLAKDLLRQDGIIFISIDDNEAFHLGLLMNRIFGEGNFLASIAWEKRYTRSNNAKLFYSVKDTVLAYRNSPLVAFLREQRTEKSDAIYKNPDNDPRGVWTSASYVNPATKQQRPNLVYPILNPHTGKTVTHPTHAWKFERESHEQHVKDGLLWWGRDGKAKYPRLKVFPKTENGGLVPLDIWKHEDTGTTDEGGQELKTIFGHAAFTNPKPTRLIERMLRLCTGPNDLVLDFFAGSGTTAHAVHKLNKEDGGNRRVILVSSTEATEDEPEKNLCRDVCATRVRRVIEGYGDTPGLGGDFAYLRCRRIDPGRLTEIDHAQVWTALQLIHCDALAEYKPAALLTVGDDEQLLVYLPRLGRAVAPALRKAVRSARAAIVYSWQPELARQFLRGHEQVQIEAVPEVLARRFGMKV